MQDENNPHFERLRVLLVEDNAFAQRLASSVLRQIGVKQRTVVTDGQAAIDLLGSSELQFDLIVSDWNMPKVTGLQLLQHVRKTWLNMPFLMLTGNANEEFVIAARENKVDAYVIKPFSASQLRQKLTVMFNMKSI